MNKTGAKKLGRAKTKQLIRWQLQVFDFIKGGAIDAYKSVHSFGHELVFGKKLSQETMKEAGEKLSFDLTAEDLRRISKCYEASRRKAEQAQLGYLRDGYASDMRRVEAKLRNSKNRGEINRLEKRWRWLNSKLCEIDQRDRGYADSFISG